MAVPEWPIEARSAASAASTGCKSLAATGEGVARIRASKIRGEGERGERERTDSRCPLHLLLLPSPSLLSPLRLHPPAVALALNSRNRRVQPHGARRQAGGNRLHQARQPLAQGDEHAVAGAALRAVRSPAHSLGRPPRTASAGIRWWRIARTRLPKSRSISRKRLKRGQARSASPDRRHRPRSPAARPAGRRSRVPAGGGRRRPCSRPRRLPAAG